MPWEKVFLFLGFMLLMIFIRTFSDKTRILLRYAAGFVILVIGLRHSSEILDLVKKYADTIWPAINHGANRFIDSLGSLFAGL